MGDTERGMTSLELLARDRERATTQDYSAETAGLSPEEARWAHGADGGKAETPEENTKGPRRQETQRPKPRTKEPKQPRDLGANAKDQQTKGQGSLSLKKG